MNRIFVIAAIVSVALSAPCLALEANPPQRYTFSEIHMAVPWKIVLYAADETAANHAAQAAYARIEELNHVLSDYDSTSELSRLSATAPSPQPVPVSDDLWRVLQFAQNLSEKTGGAFDITVGPLTKLWRRARRNSEAPTADQIQSAKKATDFRSLRLDPTNHTAQLLKPNMRLDAGGIGMGYAVDEALKVLHHEGIARALIDASGDIGLADPPPNQTGWRIGVEPPTGEGSPSRYVSLANRAITTSGDAFQSVEIAGQRYSHIIDPRTGWPVPGHSSVTVIAPDCITADSYTKPICVLGVEAGFKLIEATPGAAAFVEQEAIHGDRKLIESQETLRFHQFIIPAP